MNFLKLKTKLTEYKKADEEFKEKLIAYAKQFGVDIVYGSNKKCSVKEIDKVVMPSGDERDKFIEVLKEKGLWEDWNMLSYAKVNSGILKGDVEEDVKGMIEMEKGFRFSLSKRRDIEGDEK
jgi:translation initiation factor 1 (eIF-1/SUI1)